MSQLYENISYTLIQPTEIHIVGKIKMYNNFIRLERDATKIHLICVLKISKFSLKDFLKLSCMYLKLKLVIMKSFYDDVMHPRLSF